MSSVPLWWFKVREIRGWFGDTVRPVIVLPTTGSDMQDQDNQRYSPCSGLRSFTVTHDTSFMCLLAENCQRIGELQQVPSLLGVKV